jgi:hypothetical protein
MWYWEVLSGLFGALVYYVWRYQFKGELSFPAYLVNQWVNLFQGALGFAFFYLVYSALETLLVKANIDYALPEMNYAVAGLLGFGAKKALDFTGLKFSKWVDDGTKLPG